MRTPDDWNSEVFDRDGDAVGPRVSELHAGRREVFRGHPLQWSAEALYRAPDMLRILMSAMDPNVEVARGAGTSVSGERVCAHDQELNPLAAQGGQHVFEVWIEHRGLP